MGDPLYGALLNGLSILEADIGPERVFSSSCWSLGEPTPGLASTLSADEATSRSTSELQLASQLTDEPRARIRPSIRSIAGFSSTSFLRHPSVVTWFTRAPRPRSRPCTLATDHEESHQTGQEEVSSPERALVNGGGSEEAVRSTAPWPLELSPVSWIKLTAPEFRPVRSSVMRPDLAPVFLPGAAVGGLPSSQPGGVECGPSVPGAQVILTGSNAHGTRSASARSSVRNPSAGAAASATAGEPPEASSGGAGAAGAGTKKRGGARGDALPAPAAPVSSKSLVVGGGKESKRLVREYCNQVGATPGSEATRLLCLCLSAARTCVYPLVPASPCLDLSVACS